LSIRSGEYLRDEGWISENDIFNKVLRAYNGPCNKKQYTHREREGEREGERQR
jgi:hypothetical protein